MVVGTHRKVVKRLYFFYLNKQPCHNVKPSVVDLFFFITSDFTNRIKRPQQNSPNIEMKLKAKKTKKGFYFHQFLKISVFVS